MIRDRHAGRCYLGTSSTINAYRPVSSANISIKERGILASRQVARLLHTKACCGFLWFLP